MGALRVMVTIANVGDRSRSEQIELLVDTGATFTVLPPDVCERIDLTPDFTRLLRTADGRVLERAQGSAYAEIDGHEGTVPVVQGSDGDVPVLSVTTLEILGLAFDPVRGELRPSEHLYLALTEAGGG